MTKTIHLITLYVVLAIFSLILKDEMLSIVMDSLQSTISHVSVSRAFYIVLFLIIVAYVAFKNKVRIKGILGTICLLLVCVNVISLFHSFFQPLQSVLYYILIPLPLFMLLFIVNIATYIREDKYFQFAFAAIFIFLVYYYFESYTIRLQNLYALSNSSGYVILYFLPLVLCINNEKIKLIAILTTISVIFLTYKRGGIIALGSALFVYWFIKSYIDGAEAKWNYRTLIVSVALLMLLSCLCYYVFISMDGNDKLLARFQNIAEDEGSGRLDVYDCTWNMILESDVIGLMFGHGWNATMRDSFLKLSAHNDFLEIIYDFGVIVVSIYVYLLIRLLYYLKFLIKKHSCYAAPFAASVIIFFINSMVSHIFIYSSYLTVFTLFWGYVYAKNKHLKIY